MPHPPGYSITNGVPPALGQTRIAAQLARAQVNAERKARRQERNARYANNPKGVTPHALIPTLIVKGDPSTRPQRASVTSRARLNGRFMTALADDFEVHGKRAIERMRVHDPSGYIKTVAFLMPKQFEQTTPMQDLSDDELERCIEYLKSQFTRKDGKRARAAPLTFTPHTVPTLPKAEGIP